MIYATRQRIAVQKVLDEASHPLTPSEIWSLARQTSPGLGIATVYRALRLLADAGAVETVEIPGAPPHYGRKQPRHHHHFLCEGCRRVHEIDGCLPGIEGLAPPGFTVKSHALTLYGTCADPKCNGRH